MFRIIAEIYTNVLKDCLKNMNSETLMRYFTIKHNNSLSILTKNDN